MNIPLLDLRAQYEGIKEEIQAAITECLQNGQFILGPNVKALEGEIASYIGTQYGIGVANGTDALVLILKAMGIGAGDEVITTAYTFFASAEGISQVGATPVFVDIDPVTYCMDVNKLEERITDHTKAVIPVHLFGHPVDMDPLMEIAKRRGLKVIEDACQAIGAEYKDKKVGSFGDAAYFSFFPTKNLGGYGDGGLVVTNDETLYNRVKLLRAHGSPKKYHHAMVGYNSRLDELQASILRVKFTYLEKWTVLRRTNAARYTRLLQDVGVGLPVQVGEGRHVYHMYIIRSDRRDELAAYLQKKGISTAVYYPVPLHLLEVYQEDGYRVGDYPEAERASRETLAIPFYPELCDEDAGVIADAIREWRVAYPCIK